MGRFVRNPSRADAGMVLGFGKKVGIRVPLVAPGGGGP